MSVKGTWRAKAFAGADFADVTKQGTGFNAIHLQRGDRIGNDPGRAMVGIHGSVPGHVATDSYVGAVDPGLQDEYAPQEYGYMEEDPDYISSSSWGYGSHTGTADHPSWGQNHDVTAGKNESGEDFPSWGPESVGQLPAGTLIRSHKHGGGVLDNDDRPDANDAKVTPMDDVAQGWLNKTQSYVEDAQTSDPSQYEMNTSMTQRDKTREGSQSSGTANEFDSPVRSRITAMKLRVWGASPNLPGHAQRHDDMFPMQQDLIIRPFWLRTAGTGDASAMQANELYVSEPKQRTPPEIAWQGESVTQSTASDEYGYTSEDGFYA